MTIRTLPVILIAAVVLASGCTQQPIGGDRDEYGCLVAAGYAFDAEVNACLRDWELSQNQKDAAKIAVGHVGYEKGITILEVLVARCPGCFVVKLEKGTDRVSVNLADWEVTGTSLTPQECLEMGGRTVNAVGGDTCEEDETSAGDVTGFISPNICCISLETNREEIESESTDEMICPPVFNHEFTDYSKIDAFQPIGSITGASRGRSYIIIKEGEEVPVYAPMDATLIAVIYAYRGPEADHGEYGFLFDAGCGVTFLLDHLDSASEEMKKYAPAEPSRSTATNDRISVPVKGGTLLGYTDGTSQAGTFDFLVLDSTKEESYINPSRWEWEQSIHSICPYDLYEESLKEKYYQKIGTINDGEFIKAEDCGKLSYDIENTISGGWFKDEESTDLQGEFMLIGERLGFVDVTIKSSSESVILRITDYNTKQPPEDIGIGESVCYQGFDNDWVYLHLVDSQTIEVSNGQGTCPSTFPAADAKRYFR